MSESFEESLREILEGVTRADNQPKVVFPFGFKIIELDGERVVCPMTEDECKEFAASQNISLGCWGGCYTDFGACKDSGCFKSGGRCGPQFDPISNRIACLCGC